MTCKEFQIEPLPYGYDSLAPMIDGETLKVHHDVLYQKYADNLNTALKKYPQFCGMSLQELILSAGSMPEDISLTVFNSAGGMYNHQMYFSLMNPRGMRLPKGWLLNAIQIGFDTFQSFEAAFKKSALAVFGSGYTWLALNTIGGLEIVNTANQNTPLSLNLNPVIPLDVWEHAYFLQYKAGRSDYIDAWLKLADWERAETEFLL